MYLPRSLNAKKTPALSGMEKEAHIMTILKLFFDTETSGLPIWKEPSEHPDQPHIVQIAAKLVDLDTREVIASMDRMIKPDGWKIDQGAFEVHGITHERADAEGLPEAEVITEFLDMWKGIPRVAHIENFDARMVRIATKRFCDEAVQQLWKDGPSECTGKLAKAIMAPERKGYWKPSLADSCFFFTGKQLEDGHNAMNDVDACMAIYFAILDNKIAGQGVMHG